MCALVSAVSTESKSQHFTPSKSCLSPLVKLVMLVAAAILCVAIMAGWSDSEGATLASKGTMVISGMAMNLGSVASLSRKTLPSVEPYREKRTISRPARRLLSNLNCTAQSETMRALGPYYNLTTNGVDGGLAMVSTGGDHFLAFFGRNATIYAVSSNANHTVSITTSAVSGSPPISTSYMNPQAALAASGDVGVVYASVGMIDGYTYFGVFKTTGQQVLAPFQLFTGGKSFSYPVVIPRQAGGWIAGWISPSELDVQIINADGSTGSLYSFIPTTHNSSIARQLTLAELSSGNVLALYEDTAQIVGQLLSPTMTLINGAFLTLTGTAPMSLLLPSGNLFIAYVNSLSQLSRLILSPTGSMVFNDTPFCNTAASKIALALSADGLQVAVLFTASNGAGNFVQLFHVDGTVYGGEFPINQTSANQDLVSGTFLSDNQLLTVDRENGQLFANSFAFGSVQISTIDRVDRLLVVKIVLTILAVLGIFGAIYRLRRSIRRCLTRICKPCLPCIASCILCVRRVPLFSQCMIPSGNGLSRTRSMSAVKSQVRSSGEAAGGVNQQESTPMSPDNGENKSTKETEAEEV